MNITELSIKRPSLVVVLFTVLTFLGLLSYVTLNYELLPKFSPPVISVATVYPGASPSEIENSVSRKIEDALSSMENVDQISSTSQESFSVVVVQLNNNADVDIALQDAQRKVNAMLNDLPEDAQIPTLNKFSFDDLPILRMGASAKMDPAEFYNVIEERIQPALSQIDGVAQVNLVGGQEREIRVNIDQQKLDAYNLSILQVNNLIQASNLDFPTGKIKSQDQQVLIRVAGKYASLDELRNLVITTTNEGTLVRLQDVAEVQDTQKEAEKMTRVDLKPAIGLEVLKQSDANAVAVSEDVRAALSELENLYGGVDLSFTVAQDSSEFTLEAADGVIHDLLLAIALVAAVMLLFLHSMRNALIVMISVPVSLVATFIGLSILGFTLNLMTLLALSLVVGILVDDAIVVLENIYRHMEMGKDRRTAAIDGVKEIYWTVISITLVLVVVFLPITLVSGLVADLLRQFAMVVVISVLLSLLVSYTIIPLLSAKFGKLEHVSNKSLFGRFILWFERQIDQFGAWIVSILKWSLNHKAVVLGLTFLLLVGSIALVPLGFIGSEFVSQGDRGEFIIQLELPKDATVEQTNLITRQAEEYLGNQDYVASLYTTVGQTSDGMSATQATVNKAEINVKMVPLDARDISSSVYARQMRNGLEANIAGAKFKSTPVSIMGTANRAPVDVIIKGPSLDSVMFAANALLNEVKQIPGTMEQKLSVEDGNPEINIEVNRDKMSSLNLDLQTVGASLQMAFNGNTDAQYRDGEYEYDINIRLDEFNRKNINDIKSIILINKLGQKVRLEQIADVIQSTGPSKLERKDRITSVSVQSQVLGKPVGTVTQEVENVLVGMDLPEGVTYEFGGDAKNQSEAFQSLGLAFIASIFLVYLIMVALYDNYVYPFVVLFSIPLAIIGALFALALSNSTLSIFTLLGIIMLVGLVAKNAILVVDFANQLKAEGKPTREALLEATQVRLRPVLMTSISMIIGMLPIALASGAGASWKNGLAWAIIGGLTSSTFLTLVIVPLVYQIADSVQEKVKKRFKKEEKKETYKPAY